MLLCVYVFFIVVSNCTAVFNEFLVKTLMSFDVNATHKANFCSWFANHLWNTSPPKNSFIFSFYCIFLYVWCLNGSHPFVDTWCLFISYILFQAWCPIVYISVGIKYNTVFVFDTLQEMCVRFEIGYCLKLWSAWIWKKYNTASFLFFFFCCFFLLLLLLLNCW